MSGKTDDTYVVFQYDINNGNKKPLLLIEARLTLAMYLMDFMAREWAKQNQMEVPFGSKERSFAVGMTDAGLDQEMQTLDGSEHKFHLPPQLGLLWAKKSTEDSTDLSPDDFNTAIKLVLLKKSDFHKFFDDYDESDAPDDIKEMMMWPDHKISDWFSHIEDDLSPMFHKLQWEMTRIEMAGKRKPQPDPTLN